MNDFSRCGIKGGCNSPANCGSESLCRYTGTALTGYGAIRSINCHAPVDHANVPCRCKDRCMYDVSMEEARGAPPGGYGTATEDAGFMQKPSVLGGYKSETRRDLPSPGWGVEQKADLVKLDKSAERKATPIASGVLSYFPDAIAAVAKLSKLGNDKHNPGEPLNWSRGKSNDHADCIVRHLMDRGTIDEETGLLHDVAVAWRALAMCQLAIEKAREESL